MGPISSVRPTVLTLGTSPHLTAGQSNSAAIAARGGARVEPATAAETGRPVAPASDTTKAATGLTEDNYQIEMARARAEAAQRAYLMASLAAGLNPLNDPVP